MSDFAHRLEINRIRDGERIDLVADEGERERIAERIAVDSLDRLEASASLTRDKAVVGAKGRLRATLTQHCVVTGEPIATHVDEPFDIAFIPEPGSGGADEEVELSDDEMDMVFHDGLAIDLGNAIADTLALSIDPYPRSAGAQAALKEAGVISEAEAGPFAALAKLKKGAAD